MRPRLLSIPILGAAALAPALACYDGTLPAPDTLTPAEVGGVYAVCELRFTPSHGGLPEADVLAAVIDAAPAEGPPPSLTLSGTAPEFELVYVRRRDGSVQRLGGEMEYGEGSVFLYSTSRLPSAVPFEALLPWAHLDLVFHAATRRLTAGVEVSAYSVRRGDYAAAAGIGTEGLPDRIWGHITAAFAEGTCG